MKPAWLIEDDKNSKALIKTQQIRMKTLHLVNNRAVRLAEQGEQEVLDDRAREERFFKRMETTGRIQ